MNKKQRKKLEEAREVCSKCGNKYGKMPEGHVYTRWGGKCDICGKEGSVTSPRDYGYFRKTLGREKTDFNLLQMPYE